MNPGLRCGITTHAIERFQERIAEAGGEHIDKARAHRIVCGMFFNAFKTVEAVIQEAYYLHCFYRSSGTEVVLYVKKHETEPDKMVIVTVLTPLEASRSGAYPKDNP